MKRNIKLIIICMLFSVLWICLGFTASATSDNYPENVSGFIQTDASADTAVISWNKVEGAEKYKVYRYDSQKKKYVSYEILTDNTCEITGLEAGKNYRFKVKAINTVDSKNYYSKNSAFLTVKTSPEKVEKLTCTNKKKKSFKLKWNEVSKADGYQVYILNEETDKWKAYKTTENTEITLKKEGIYKVSAYRIIGEKKYFGAKSAKKTCSFKAVKSKSGVFTFTCYGRGHGVGMSQRGAEALAQKGWKYDEILTHYYKDTKIKKDKKMPSKVKYGGKKYSLKQYLQRVVQAEIGGYVSYETVKAQVVACYTYAKSKNFDIKSYEHAFSSKAAVSDKVKKAVNKVMGEYVSYKGKTCITPYHALSAGKTSSSLNAWGVDYPYLEQVSSSSDRKNSDWKRTYTVSSEEIKAKAKEAYGIELKGDPSKWIKILEHDGAVSSYIGYVEKIRIGSETISGEQFRAKILGYKIRSHCYTVSYTPD